MEAIREAALTFLLNSLWQGLVVAAAAALGAWLLRHVPARRQHRLWAAALALSVLLPLASLRPRAAAAPAAARAGGQTEAVVSGPQPVTVEIPWGWLVAGAYLGFLLYRAARLAQAWRMTTRIGRSAFSRPLPQPMRAALDRCRLALNLPEVQVLCSERVAGPVTAGAWRPVVILPPRLFEEAPVAALAHELAHVARRDFLLNVLFELLYLPIAMWPAAWMLKRRVDRTRELACDELVTEKLVDARSYARELVWLAESMAAQAEPGYTLGVFDAGILEERVRRLVSCKSRARAPRLVLAAATVMLTVSVLAGLTFSLAPAPGAAHLAGTVWDPSGAVVPRAAVSVTNLASGATRTVTSGQAGLYQFSRLPAGTYRLEVRARGFALYRQSRVVVKPSQNLRLDALLRLGRVVETISVHASS